MGRRIRGPVSPEEEEYRVNRRIRIPEVRVIAPDGEQLGLMSTDEARARAADAGLDLVEVAPNARPPVCRIMDYGKFKYDRSKRTSGANTAPELKTVQVRPKTDDHDLETKLRRARKFLERGDKVRLVMRMRGREQAYPERWIALMRGHFTDALAEVGEVAQPPTRQGRTISMLIEPAANMVPAAKPSGGASASSSSTP